MLTGCDQIDDLHPESSCRRWSSHRQGGLRGASTTGWPGAASRLACSLSSPSGMVARALADRQPSEPMQAGKHALHHAPKRTPSPGVAVEPVTPERSPTLGRPDDVAAIAALLAELDRFYGATNVEPVSQRVPQISAALFAQQPAAAQALLAWEDRQLVGLATYSLLWPAVGVTQSLYLKELYVAQEHRGRGVGRRLMQEVCRVATEHGCSRVEWTTDTDNSDAQHFYAKLGVSALASNVFYRLDGQDLVRAAGAAVDPSVDR